MTVNSASIGLFMEGGMSGGKMSACCSYCHQLESIKIDGMPVSLSGALPGHIWTSFTLFTFLNACLVLMRTLQEGQLQFYHNDQYAA